ncbi:hypothetical protein Ddc_17973 [Ditylenchus destructor]|nr:hypothetical protein Ddc_17973 [Ditylenchus destructor]
MNFIVCFTILAVVISGLNAFPPSQFCRIHADCPPELYCGMNGICATPGNLYQRSVLPLSADVAVRSVYRQKILDFSRTHPCDLDEPVTCGISGRCIEGQCVYG